MRTAFLIVALSVTAGCSDSLSPPKSLIDPDKVIDMDAPTLFAMRITIFCYAEADVNGWPARRECQQYVRFLQDRDIDVGFVADAENKSFVAMVAAADVGKVKEADAAAKTEGVTKPPLVPASMLSNE
ncbi:MAG: hypothetical protein AAF497_03200 [Planctomycetota bacterium]